MQPTPAVFAPSRTIFGTLEIHSHAKLIHALLRQGKSPVWPSFCSRAYLSNCNLPNQILSCPQILASLDRAAVFVQYQASSSGYHLHRRFHPAGATPLLHLPNVNDEPGPLSEPRPSFLAFEQNLSVRRPESIHLHQHCSTTEQHLQLTRSGLIHQTTETETRTDQNHGLRTEDQGQEPHRRDGR